MGTHHYSHRVGWLRAGVLGANDGIVSVASLLVGVAAAGQHEALLLTAVASTVAGALSMAAGEFVSVSTQADTERSDLERERLALEEQSDEEEQELTEIYVGRGVSPELAAQVARELMAHDALGAHARDELGFSASSEARPLLAAVASALAFLLGATVPTIAALVASASQVATFVGAATLTALAVTGATGAYLGGAPLWRGALRVMLWGAFAMLLTGLVGHWFGVATL